MNHGVNLRIQLCLILKRLGLPRDLRQLLIRKVWFDCQSEVLRQERLIWFPMRPKFVLPILEKVEKCGNSFQCGRIGTYLGINKWRRFYASNVENVMDHFEDENNYPSVKKLRKLKKLKI